jgi:hypothetical protein
MLSNISLIVNQRYLFRLGGLYSQGVENANPALSRSGLVLLDTNHLRL